MEPINPAGEEANEIASVVGIEPGWAVCGDANGQHETLPMLRIHLTRYPVGTDGEPYDDILIVHIDDAASYQLAAAMASFAHAPTPPTDQ